MEESFLPTVRTLMNAPATSPLAEVDVNNVVELLVELTRPSVLIKPSTNTEVRTTQRKMCYCFLIISLLHRAFHATVLFIVIYRTERIYRLKFLRLLA